MTTPDGVQTTTTSTFRGKPAYVQVGTQAGVTPLPAEANTYDTSDNLTQSTSPNGVVTSHTYDEYNDLASTTTASGPTSPTSLTGASETTNETWNVLGDRAEDVVRRVESRHELHLRRPRRPTHRGRSRSVERSDEHVLVLL